MLLLPVVLESQRMLDRGRVAFPVVLIVQRRGRRRPCCCSGGVAAVSAPLPGCGVAAPGGVVRSAPVPRAVFWHPGGVVGSALEPVAVLCSRWCCSPALPIRWRCLRSDRVGAAKKPFMSIITFAVAGPWLYTLIPPLTVPAGTMAALATIAPCGSFNVATKGWNSRTATSRCSRPRPPQREPPSS